MRIGSGAICTVKLSRIHPSKHIRNKYPNHTRKDEIVGVRILRQEEKIVHRKQQLSVVFVHDEFKDDGGQHIELYCVKRWAHVTAEGDANLFFDVPPPPPAISPTGSEPDDINPHPMIARMATTVGPLSESDIAEARTLVNDVDDDNRPAPENIPARNESVPNIFNAAWGHSGSCNRKKTGPRDYKPRLEFGNNESMPTVLKIFESFFFQSFIKNVIIPATNQTMPGNRPLTYGEFLVFIGLWLLMATIVGPERRDYWSTKPIDMFEGAPFRLSHYMSRARFELILRHLSFTDKQAPPLLDRFWQVRPMISAWNDNMSRVFSPGWICCLDESMSTWINQYTCPGFMFVPRKPWPFGNEYHTICCGISGILFAMELVEGKDQPRQLRNEEDNFGKTVGLLLRLTRSLWGSARVLVLDSGFCVLKGLIELAKKGVYGSALIKKRKYWPKYIRGDEIKDHFKDMPVGSVDSIGGNLDGIDFDVFCMKEPDYVMMLMSTYGTNIRMGEHKNRDGVEAFQYPEVVHNHYQYRHQIDDHNNKRHQPISLEVTWATKTWENRVFAYLLATTEVNCNLASSFFIGEPPLPSLSFRKELARELLLNPYFNRNVATDERPKRKRTCCEHTFTTLRAYTKWQGSDIIPSSSIYPQRMCKGKHRKVRTYCSCSPGVVMCEECYAQHKLEIDGQ
ncbi:transposase IS4 [Nitzschia inconspicua]|uniref:Transposase IS4 n=1 Tax=Nitzschia inconspicua TaxID=303405 RepID=A0A9K3PR62_9STRA|nr:transposase IS4 [Nitzschia inconspicua]KAG7358457.1 transposase IS4 [Nitzschia inconspicua]